MNNAYFRYNEDENQLAINFRYQNPEFKIDRDFNFARNPSENIDLCLERMRNNLEKEFSKKTKKKTNKKSQEAAAENSNEMPTLPEISVKFVKAGEALNNVTFLDLFKDFETKEDIILKIINQDFKIAFNQPWVVSVSLPSSILAGFEVFPNKMDIQFGTKKDSKGVWSRGQLPPSKNINQVKWEQCGEGLTYKTKTEDIGYHLKFELIPGNGKEFGPSIEAISKSEIQAGPGVCPFEERHLFTKEKLSGDRFRVVSYNLLADLYADSDYSRTQLFPYCPPYALAIDYRKQLFIKELVGFQGDIMCLQEVDAKIFNHELSHTFCDFFNYMGNFTQKGNSGEGLATFYNSERFEQISTHSVQIGVNIPLLDVFEDLWMKIRSNIKLAKRITERSTALQVTVLKSKETGHYLVVANTHLYFHPDADHIRLLQIGFSMKYVEDVRRTTMKDNQVPQDKISIIFCGDFNSVPECGIYKLMTENLVGEDFIDWRSKEEEAVHGVTLRQPFNIASATGCPQYTNFTHLFAACLDYIFYQTDNIEVTEVIPLPSEEQLKTHIAIPSVVFPSDHVSLVADLKFR